MENREGNAVPQSALLSTNIDNEVPMNPMSEQNVRDKGIDNHPSRDTGEGCENVDDVAKGREGNSAMPISLVVASQGPEGSDGNQVAKRKRGRPRKSEVNAAHMVLPASSVGTDLQISLSVANPAKRSRGRPRGTGRLQLLASSGGIVAESAGGIFTTHEICVNPGDDVVSTIKQLSWGPRAVVILSAEGSVSSISIRAAGGILQFKGNLEITNLNGSFVHGGTGGSNNKVGSLSIIFSYRDGKLYGGQVEGMMIAATPVRIIAGSFKQSICNELRNKYPAESPAAVRLHDGMDESPLLSGTLGGGAISETQHFEPSLHTVGQETSMPLQSELQQSIPP